MRHVVAHYHIFKNAGSSIDALLRASFGAAWVQWDPGEAAGAIPADRLTEFLLQHPGVAAISSHLVRPPFHDAPDLRIHPVFLLRHPLLRCASIYKYERKLNGQTEAERVAASSTFAHYIQWRLRNEAAVIRNFQTVYLSGERFLHAPGVRILASDAAFERALTLLHNAPIFGIVERFPESARMFEEFLRPFFPQIRFTDIRVNTTETSLTTLEEIRDALGADLYAELEANNEYDLALYSRAQSIFFERQKALTRQQ
jgi:hypothetical protein